MGYKTFFCFLWFKVCQLRERRLDLEEELAEEKKTSETLKKEYDALVKKAKIIDSALKTAEADLEAFQVTTHKTFNKELWSKYDSTMIECGIWCSGTLCEQNDWQGKTYLFVF